MAASDGELLESWHAGDESAGQALVARHFDSIYRFFTSKVAGEADELVQATFLACLKATAQFRRESSFRTYLFAIARNTLYRFLETRARDGARLDFDHSSIAELVTTPATRLDRGVEHARLLEALRRLPIAQQTLLELYYWEGLSSAELATVFDSVEVTIRSRLHRARNALRDLMAGVEPAAAASLESLDAWARDLERDSPKK